MNIILLLELYTRSYKITNSLKKNYFILYIMSESLANQLDDPQNLEKYKCAGKIITQVLDKIIKKIEIGSVLKDLCEYGDNILKEYLNNAFSKKSINQICFPTCICKNEYAGYLNQSIEKVEEFDLLKIELGAMVDGFPALICFTHYVIVENSSNIDPNKEKKENLINCLSKMSKKAADLFKHETINTYFVSEMTNLCKLHKCNILDGMFDRSENHIPGQIFYQISKNIVFGRVDGYIDEDELHNLVIMRQSDNFDFHLEKQELGFNETYFVDLSISTGKGKVSESEYKNNIYLRNIDKRVSLKLNISKNTLKSFDEKTIIPKDFNLEIKKNNKLSMGIKECVKNLLLEPFKIVKEKKNEYIARFGFTIIIRRSSKKNKTGQIIIASRSLDSEIKKFELNQSTNA